MEAYSSISEIYDIWQENNDTQKWVSYIQKIIKKHLSIKRGDGQNGELILLDLGCGTGDFAIEMSKQKMEVIGIDKSMEMLNLAKAKKDSEKVTFICQDIQKFELFGTVDIIVCLLDTVNHLKSEKSLDKMFRLCKNYLNPNGLMIFDLATAKYFKETLGNETFFDIRDDFALIWENSYNAKSGTNKANLTYFTKIENNLYSKGEEVITEKAFDINSIDKIIGDNGLVIVKKYQDFKLKNMDENSDRIFYVIENRKDIHKQKLRKLLEGNKNGSKHIE